MLPALRPHIIAFSRVSLHDILYQIVRNQPSSQSKCVLQEHQTKPPEPENGTRNSKSKTKTCGLNFKLHQKRSLASSKGRLSGEVVEGRQAYAKSYHCIAIYIKRERAL